MGAPFPVVALLRRARNEKSSKARHDTAFYAWEASIRLGVAAAPPADVTSLELPSTGHWVHGLGASARPELARSHDGAAILAAHALFVEVGQDRKATPRAVTATTVLDALPAYRNVVLGHGGARPASYYDRGYEVLAAALVALWDAEVFWPAGAVLVHVDAVSVAPGGGREARVLRLDGESPVVEDFRGATPVPDGVAPQRSYLRQGEAYRGLAPWMLFQETDLGERVWFWNGRKRAAAQYLDFASGEVLRGKPLVAAFPGLDAEVERTFAAAPSGPTDKELSDTPDEPDRVGDYRILGELGRGGMGEVSLARHETLGRLVALKRLPAHLADDAQAVARFRREVAALSRCEHPGVIKVLAAGDAHGRPWYAMELVEGADLAHVARSLATSGDFDAAVSTASEAVRKAKHDAFARAPAGAWAADAGELVPTRRRDRVRALAELFRDAARAVQHLHDRKIVHRDLKPGNLMVTASDHHVVVMDLGLAALGDASQSLTRDKSQLLGTLRYMPPEQLQRTLLDVDHRADVYSLGATFYELFTGKPFFDGDSEVRLIEQVLRATPVPPRQAEPTLPRDVATILEKATEKDPARRYATAAALADDVAAWLEGRPIAARPASLAYMLGLAVRRHRAAFAAAALALVLAVGATIFFFQRERGLRADAQAARRAAAAEAERANRTSLELLTERGRIEMLGGNPRLAALFLGESYAGAARQGVEPSSTTRFLLAAAMRSVDAAIAALDPGVVTHDVAFSADGTRVATAGANAFVRVFDAASGAPVAELRGHTGAVRVVSFLPDGRLLSASDDGSARIWDVATGTAIVLDNKNPVAATAISPDGAQIATAGTFATARLWDARTGAELAILHGHTGDVIGVAFSRDGTHVVTLDDVHSARVWDARPASFDHDPDRWGGVPEAPQVSILEDASPSTVAINADGTRVVTTSWPGTFQVWDVTRPQAVAVGEDPLGRSQELFQDARYTPRGAILVIGEAIEAWDPDLKFHLFSFTGHIAEIRALALDATGGRLVTASFDRTARIWDLESLRPVAAFEHPSGVSAAELSPDGGRAATIDDDGAVRLWNARRTTEVATLGHGDEDEFFRRSIAVSADSRHAIAAGGKVARLFALPEGGPGVVLARDAAAVYTASFSRDGALAVTGGEGAVEVWDVATRARVTTFSGHEGEITSASFSPDGTRVVSAGVDRKVQIWNARTGGDVVTIPEPDIAFHAVFRPDGTQLATAAEDIVRIWDAASGGAVGTLVHTERVESVAFSPDGRLVLTVCHDEHARLWDAATLAMLHELPLDTSGVRWASFSPDGTRLLASSANRTARIWDTATGKLVTTLAGHTAAVLAGAFSPDGARVVTDSHDHTSRLWDAEHGALLGTLPSGIELNSAPPVFSPDGRWLLTSTQADSTIWDVGPELRGPDEIAAILARELPWRLDGGHAVPR